MRSRRGRYWRVGQESKARNLCRWRRTRVHVWTKLVGMDLAHARLGQIANVVHDVDASVQFYRDRLGLKLLFQVPGMAFFDFGGVRLMLSKAEKPEQNHPGSFLYLKVEDLEATYRTLKERQVTFIDTPHLVAKMKDHELWMTFFEDPDKNPLALMSEKPL